MARKGKVMSEYDRITNKLNRYLIDNMGFKKNGIGLSKVLKADDIDLSDEKVVLIATGRLYGGSKEIYYEAIEEDYLVGRIEERFEEFLTFTDKERAWLNSFDEEGFYGADLISDYIWNYINVAVDRKIADKHMAKVMNGKETVKVA